jgi:hypothetical protein
VEQPTFHPHQLAQIPNREAYMRQYANGDLIAGEYEVLQVFGGVVRSGMGVVYLVTHPGAPALFVLKTYY